MVRRTRWYPVSEKLPAACLIDLGAPDNILSFWRADRVPDDIKEIVVAIAAKRENLQHVDLALVDEDDVTRAGIKLDETEGDTPYAAARLLHRLVVELSADDVLAMAKLIEAKNDYPRYTKREVRDLMLAAVRQQRLALRELEDNVQEDLTKHL